MADMEIRQISAEERTALMWPLQAYAFWPSPWKEEATATYARRMEYYGTVVSLVAEEDGAALAGVGALPMRQNVRGLVHDMAGVASVASHPSARRRGLVRTLLQRLLRQMRDQGCATSALYPFRPSFYGRHGYVGVPRVRTATFAPEGLSHLLRANLPGTVERLPMSEGFADYTGLTLRLLSERHGFAVFDETRRAEFRTLPSWLAIARVDGEVVGAVEYRIEQFGGDLVASDLLTTGPMGRALLLQFFARHVDQVARIVVTVGTEEVPELWGTDLPVLTEGRVEHPRKAGPMVRVLDLEKLAGTPVGAGAVTVEVVDDELIGGRYRLCGDDGRLTVERAADGAAADATLTCAGLSGLVYGVLDPVDVMTRGFGRIEASAIAPLRSLFPREMPYLFADF
jgi:predicted acetyltransferase